MTTTTEYGTWNTHGDDYNVSVEATIADRISGGDTDWLERVETSGAFEKMASDYRDAINDALPDGVTLIKNDFLGPYYNKDYTWEGELDIAEIIKGVDLDAIVDRHDPGLT